MNLMKAAVFLNSMIAGMWSTMTLAGVSDGEFGDHMHDGWFMGPFMMLAGIAVVILTVFLVVRIFDSNSHGNNSKNRNSTAVQILEERFARGELNAEEFKTMKMALDN